MELFRRARGRLLVLGAVALVAAAIAVPAFAQNASESETPDDAATAEAVPGEERFADARDAFAEALAAELDLPVDRVNEALTAVREQLMEQRHDDMRAALEDRLDEAVAAGSLTREQADAILDAAEAGVLGDGRGHGLRGFGHHGPRGGFGDGAPYGDGAPFGDEAPTAAPQGTSLSDQA
jgi:hypothetical protein